MQRVEKGRDDHGEHTFVVQTIGNPAPKASFRTRWRDVELAESAEHREPAAVLERHAANVDRVTVAVLAHQIETRHLAAIVGPALLDAHDR